MFSLFAQSKITVALLKRENLKNCFLLYDMF